MLIPEVRRMGPIRLNGLGRTLNHLQVLIAPTETLHASISEFPILPCSRCKARGCSLHFVAHIGALACLLECPHPGFDKIYVQLYSTRMTHGCLRLFCAQTLETTFAIEICDFNFVCDIKANQAFIQHKFCCFLVSICFDSCE